MMNQSKPMSYDENHKRDGYDEILELLWTRECCKGNSYGHVSKKDATNHHMSMVEDPARERELLAQGNQLFEQGYRIHHTSRQLRGLVFTIPNNAIQHRIVSAGYLASQEMQRLQYVTKKITDG